jgi:fibronectin type 3 domain-containing protein
MNRGSTDNISVMTIGLNNPNHIREAKKGNEHIKILSTISSNKKRGNLNHNKENSYPDKMKEIDSKIMEINRNANKILQQNRRS